MPSKTFTLIATLKLLISLVRFTYADIAVLNPENKSVELFIDYKITYTPAIPENGMIGFLMRAHPPDACSKLDPPPPPSNHTFQNWFVLADRSYSVRCSNREKIQNAAEAGFKVIILYSPYDNYFQSSMTYYSLDHSNTSIPAILVSHEDGNALAKKYLYQTGFKIYVTSDIPPNLSYYLLPFAIVIGVCLLLTISFMIFQLIRCVQERRKAQRHRLSKKYLKKLPLQKFEKGIYYETCAICLDDYVDGEKIRILPCNHGYHMKCIDPWLTKNRRVCPVCKAKVTLPGMPESDDSDSDNDRRARSTAHVEDANERTQLLPSSSSSRGHRSRRYNLSRLIEEVRGDGPPPPPPPSSLSSGAAASSSITSGQPNYNTASTSRYEPLDDTLSQPGPSTSSAPVISELSSQRDHGGSGGGSSGRSKRKRGHSRNVQVVAAEIAPLIAPPQLSINCDSDVERLPSRSATMESNDSEQVITTSSSSSSQKRPSKRPSVDHIV